MAFVVPNLIAPSGWRAHRHPAPKVRPISPSKRPRPSKRRRPCTRALLIDFAPSDFEIRRIVGQQAFANITDWEYYGVKDPLAPTRTVQPSQPAIRLYDARITSNFPRLSNARVMLKEFLKDGVELGVNEAEAYQALYQATAGSVDPDVVPVATLLGTFMTDESFSSPDFAASWARRFPNSPNPPTAGAPFLVFRWEGMQTGLNCAAAKDAGADPGTSLLDKWFPSNLMQRRSIFLRVFMKRTLDALYYLHSTGGIVHRSMGLASIMVNTAEYRLASSLLVKIRDLGFAKPVSALAVGDGLEKARKAGAVTPGEIASFYNADDIYALGYAFLEVIFSSYGGKPVTQDRFKVLFEDTFELDVSNFRQYCAEDPEWTEAVSLLDKDDGAGWDLLKTMLGSRENFKNISVESLRNSTFFRPRN
ncbi:unnamed protein product [Chondrus crispus]|uniref:Protein kinase domain-containing protein n=1 Tax=Chondrus crispus TaxID=2769 RepID=R7Q3P8_CHOCR|nr:unnamed protein product [Chondrus crispus]CDF33157.1 unnamed protein product [Chondrus crispus]|eukprot:XP_005712960.1 unnamed protein product [Chondrus crispus]